LHFVLLMLQVVIYEQVRLENLILKLGFQHRVRIVRLQAPQTAPSFKPAD